MKNNLKNMPDTPSKKVITWKRDIEKELQEKLWNEDSFHDDLIKEILGKWGKQNERRHNHNRNTMGKRRRI